MKGNNLVVLVVIVLAIVAGYMFYQSQQADVVIDLPDVEIGQ